MEFWDREGNYVEFWGSMSAQGNSSLAYEKKNLAIDCFRDEAMEEELSFKFGDWVGQDSFHLKAYYTDSFRGVCAVGYALCEQVACQRGYGDRRPYEGGLEVPRGTSGLSPQHGVEDGGATGVEPEVRDAMGREGKCFPQGFPVVVFVKGVFYGVYSWQLKKHRDNFRMDKKEAAHVHLDGKLSEGTLWGGDISWGEFEVRNPKSLVDVDGVGYDGDHPRELMGVDSSLYVSSDKDMKRTGKVKEAIVALSGRVGEFAAAEAGGATQEEMRELIGRYFMVDFLIDYILVTNLLQDGDGYAKNWQWTTWDGVRWTANAYDLDGIFGNDFIGNILNDPWKSLMGTSLGLPTGWVWKYFRAELEGRWRDLRDCGVFSVENVVGLLEDWVRRIGSDVYDAEWGRWSESPCWRESLMASEFWVWSRYYPSAWVSDKVYGVGEFVLRGDRVCRSLSSVNRGHDPAGAGGGDWWEDVMFDSERSYSVGDEVFYGKRRFYGFRCVKGCRGVAPLSGFYSKNPEELGHFDSVERVRDWLVVKLGYLDGSLHYTGPLDLREARVIGDAEIEGICS
ncbi:MAG: hypothetical protein HDS08_00345 [Bacteroides sp.]|nr:hypothetical protein [Bacteroides sp.]